MFDSETRNDVVNESVIIDKKEEEKKEEDEQNSNSSVNNSTNANDKQSLPESKEINDTLDKDTEKSVETNLKTNDANTSKLDKEMVGEILLLKQKISTLISNIRDTKTLCDKYENQNQYLQEYVGSLMKSSEMK